MNEESQTERPVTQPSTRAPARRQEPCICLFHRQIHGSRRRAGARVRGGIFWGYDARPQCWTRYWCRYGKILYDLYNSIVR